MKRKMSVNGSFYPSDPKEIQRYFEHFTSLYDAKLSLATAKARAVIVPHAGYIYSGFSASVAYRILAQSGIKKFAVIGPSHRIGFQGISLGDFENYETPFGVLKQDKILHQKIKDAFSLSFLPDAHHEHSTEVQFPFLKYYINDASIVELVYSDADAMHLSTIINTILSDEAYGVIISTDLSHFYTQEQANKLDAICLEAVENLNVERLHSGCEACGILGIEAMMLSAKELALDVHLLDYRTSGDASGDDSRVVGYMSAYFE